MFDQAGLNYPPQNIGDPYVWSDGTEVEWNWETISIVAKALSLDISGRNAYDANFDRNNIVQVGFVPQWASPQIVGTFFEPGLVYGGQVGSYTASIPDGWKDAWYWWFDGMWGNQPFIPTGPLSSSPEFGGGNVFNSGRAAMAVTQLWYTCCLGDAGDSWDLAALPSYNGVVHGRMDADTFLIWQDTEHPEEAFEVLTYLIGPEGTESLMAAYGHFPALPEYQQAYLNEKEAQYPFVENWDLIYQTLNYPDIPSSEAWMPNFNESKSRIDSFGDLIQNSGGINFQVELEALETDLEEIFNE